MRWKLTWSLLIMASVQLQRDKQRRAKKRCALRRISIKRKSPQKSWRTKTAASAVPTSVALSPRPRRSVLQVLRQEQEEDQTRQTRLLPLQSWFHSPRSFSKCLRIDSCESSLAKDLRDGPTVICSMTQLSSSVYDTKSTFWNSSRLAANVLIKPTNWLQWIWIFYIQHINQSSCRIMRCIPWYRIFYMRLIDHSARFQCIVAIHPEFQNSNSNWFSKNWLW